MRVGVGLASRRLLWSAFLTASLVLISGAVPNHAGAQDGASALFASGATSDKAKDLVAKRAIRPAGPDDRAFHAAFAAVNKPPAR